MMGGIRNNKPGAKPTEKDSTPSQKPPPKPAEDDDIEDGDFATPKRDRDDEQQGL